MNLMPLEKFNTLQARWGEFKPYLRNPTEFDQGIADVLDIMNGVPGLVSIWSCQGHPEKDGVKRNTSGYIMFAVRDVEALVKLQLFYSNVSALYNRQRNLVRLSMTERGDITLEQRDRNEDSWYPVWILNWGVHFNNAERRWAQLKMAALAAVKGDRLEVVNHHVQIKGN